MTRRRAKRTEPQVPDPEVADEPAEVEAAGEPAPADGDDQLDEAAVGTAAAEVEPPAEEAVTERLQAEVDELKERYLRLAADFDNFRKRTVRDRAEGRVRAQGDLLSGLLDALDDLARVAHPDHAQANSKDVIAGVELVERKLLKQLEGAGLERVGEPGDAFDPNVHEAVASAPAASETEDQTVALVMQIGYRFHGLLLRPARVQVRVWSGEPATE